MWIGIVSLFPEMFAAVTAYGITGRAANGGLISVETWNPREFARDRHRTVDDKPYGGGPGMLMKVEPLQAAIASARAAAPAGTRVIYLSPQGRKLDQADLRRYAEGQGLILVAGRYEGIDERLIESFIDEEVSIGDFVLSGGEIPAMVLIDGVTRLLPGAVGDSDSVVQESFTDGLLDYPQYTRPEEINGEAVPEVLLSGHHQAIATWRLQQALGRTFLRRPELIDRNRLTDEEQALLEAFLASPEGNRGQDDE